MHVLTFTHARSHIRTHVCLQYIGEWLEGEFQKGEWKFKDGSSYKGSFKGGRPAPVSPVCLSVCMHTCVCVCIRVCVYVYIYIYIYIYISASKLCCVFVCVAHSHAL
jgi:hypothetical protein